MAPNFIVMVREAVVVSATHGGLLYLLIHCSIAQWAKILLYTTRSQHAVIENSHSQRGKSEQALLKVTVKF